MPKIDDIIKDAIIKASDKHGSQAQLARLAGLMPSALSRYLNGQIKRINASTWNMLYPFIKDFLPEEYQRKFLWWKSKEEWEKYAEQYPEHYKNATKYIDEMDMKETAAPDPLYSRETEFTGTVELLRKKLPYLSQKTLDRFLLEAITEINGKS